MSKDYIFGTDGIRGEVNKYPIYPDFILKLGMLLGSEIKKNNPNKRCSILVGKDTRVSCDMLESLLVSAFSAVGVDTCLVGILPTSAVSFLTNFMKADLGIMLTASHNPYDHGGLKLFDRFGFKIDSSFEKLIEKYLSDDLSESLVSSSNLGKSYHLQHLYIHYIDLVTNTVSISEDVSHMKIIIDCANGAASSLAHKIFRSLGFNPIIINNIPNGTNINENCGSSFPEGLVKVVKNLKADVGFAFDGDADRIVVVNENGTIVDGDQLIATIAKNLVDKKKLFSSSVISSYMSSSSLAEYLATFGLKLYLSQIGDRNIMDMMKKHDSNLGGEKSGHIILRDYVNTSDGLIAALQILSMMIEKKKLASEIFCEFVPTPQINYNIIYDANVDSEYIKNVEKEVQKKFSDNYRIVIRKSGTEKVIRVMIEGDKLNETKDITDFIKLKFQSI